MHESEKWKWSHSVVSNSSRPHGLKPTRLLRPWDFRGKSTRVGCHCLLCILNGTHRQRMEPRKAYGPMVVVQLLSPVWLFVTPWTAVHQAPLSFTISWSLLKLISIELVMPSNHLILCCPRFLPPSIFPRIRVFPNELALQVRWPKYWSFSFSISPSSEYSGLISFRMVWFDLLAAQGILKSLFQHQSSKASILWHSAFFYCPALMEWEVKWWDWMPWNSFFECWVLSPGFFHSPFSPSSRRSLIPLCFLAGPGTSLQEEQFTSLSESSWTFGFSALLMLCFLTYLWVLPPCHGAVPQLVSVFSAFHTSSILHPSHHHPLQVSSFFPFYLPPLNSVVTRMWDENIIFVYWIKNNACNILTFKNYFPKTPSVI